jgi:hypothetical protein
MVRTFCGTRTMLGLLLIAMDVLRWSSSCFASTIVMDGPIHLSSLVADPQTQITIGDLSFNNFHYSYSGEFPSATNVNVLSIVDDLDDANPSTNNYGIRFQGAFYEVGLVPGGSDALIGYDVTALNPLLFITEAHLAGNPSLIQSTGSIYVSESFFSPDLNAENTIQIYDDELVAVPKVVDWTYFYPPKRLFTVVTEIIAAIGVDSALRLTFLDETYFEDIWQPPPDFPIGDYNLNYVVDAADYTVWRNSLGQIGAGLAADGDASGTIDAGDYDVWKMHFGQTAGDGARAQSAPGESRGVNCTVPEPESSTLILFWYVAARFALRRSNPSSRATTTSARERSGASGSV